MRPFVPFEEVDLLRKAKRMTRAEFCFVAERHPSCYPRWEEVGRVGLDIVRKASMAVGRASWLPQRHEFGWESLKRGETRVVRRHVTASTPVSFKRFASRRGWKVQVIRLSPKTLQVRRLK